MCIRDRNKVKVREKALENHLREVERISPEGIEAKLERDRLARERSQEGSEEDRAESNRISDAEFAETFGGTPSQVYGMSGRNTGGLASKRKLKPKQKKNTKGLGTKPKAT